MSAYQYWNYPAESGSSSNPPRAPYPPHHMGGEGHSQPLPPPPPPSGPSSAPYQYPPQPAHGQAPQPYHNSAYYSAQNYPMQGGQHQAPHQAPHPTASASTGHIAHTSAYESSRHGPAAQYAPGPPPPMGPPSYTAPSSHHGSHVTMAPIASGSHHSAPPKNSHKLPSLAAALAGHDQSFASPPPTPPPAQTLPSIQSLHATISGMNPYDPQFNSMGRIDYAHQDGRETMSLDRPRMHSGESSSAHEQQSHMSARDYQYGSNHGPASQPREIPRGGSSYYQPRHPYSVSHDATTSPSHLKEGRYQSYPEHTRRASPSDMEATYAEPERDVKMDTDMAPIPERSAAPSKGRRGNRTSSGSAPLEASAPPPPSKKSHPRKRSIMMVEDESVAGKQASVSINAAGVKTYECPTCHKTYKHANCLHKHKWEHTEYWAFASQFSMSKHQQVQLLEAASILVALGQGNAPASDGQPSKSGNVGGGDMLREGAEVEEFDRGGVEASSSGGRRVKREKLARDSKGSQGPIEVEG